MEAGQERLRGPPWGRYSVGSHTKRVKGGTPIRDSRVRATVGQSIYSEEASKGALFLADSYFTCSCQEKEIQGSFPARGLMPSWLLGSLLKHWLQ